MTSLVANPFMTTLDTDTRSFARRPLTAEEITRRRILSGAPLRDARREAGIVDDKA